MRMASGPKRVTISGPELAGFYEVVEQRSDGSLLLRPEPELLSKVLPETDGAVFRDKEFIAHLERVMATEEGPPRRAVRLDVPTFERLARFDREFRRLPPELQRAFPGDPPGGSW